jgi:hypothetical protein
MGESSYDFDALSTKEGFNKSLRHFKLVMDIINDFSSNSNLADIIQNLMHEKKLIIDQIKPIIYSLLVDKYNYSFASYNIDENIDKFDSLAKEFAKWSAVDVVLAYFHPEMGIVPINPKNIDHWQIAQTLKKNELLTIFVGEFQSSQRKELYADAISATIALLKGRSLKAPPALSRGKIKFKPVALKPIKQEIEKKAPPKRIKVAEKPSGTLKKEETKIETPQQSTGPKGPMHMTPFYGITVTNELFHNGNVEAWKKIIASYEYSHPDLRVFVFYDGERIQDINTLFKWGKVKRGTDIMIQVGGDNIQNVAKLKRYLIQGASHRFEDFLRGSPNQLLKLF